MQITAFFTNSGVPASGLSATIRIRDVSDNSLVITDAVMTEVGDGWYKYSFVGYDADTDYAIRCDGSATLSGTERYTYAGNDNYKDDIRDAILSDSTAFLGADITAIRAKTDTIAWTDVTTILQIEKGRWLISGNQMIFYDSDGTTPLFTFDLKDSAGSPTQTDVMERAPI